MSDQEHANTLACLQRLIAEQQAAIRRQDYLITRVTVRRTRLGRPGDQHASRNRRTGERQAGEGRAHPCGYRRSGSDCRK